jgi:RimJ/RimL family protein N-acetyltransferase
MKVADLELRPATLDDAALVADILTELHPDDPEDPKLLRHAWTMVDPDATVERFIASLRGKDVGFANRSHQSWSKMPERFARIGGGIRPAELDATRVDALLAEMEERSAADGAKAITAWAWEDDALHRGVLDKRGYREERRSRFWELDLVANKDRIEKMTDESRARMRKDGIEILTLARDADPDKFHKLKRMSDEAESDIPTTVPHVPLPFEQFMLWFGSPGLREDRIWIAREDGDIVGISQLSYPPVRGFVMTDWTGTARKVRGRGVARALKCETLMQAMALGVDRVRTDNDSTNVPILHINETMGYRRRHDGIQYLKVL